MTYPAPEEKQVGPLARVGQNDSFAGVTRLAIVFFGVVLTGILAWAGSDIRGVIADVRDNQTAIISLGSRTTRLEDTSLNTTNAITEFRQWMAGQVQSFSLQTQKQGNDIYELQSGQGKATSRIQCLEHHTTCPQ